MEVKEKMVADLKASDARKSEEVDRLKRELHKSRKKVRLLDEALARAHADKDRALVQATIESQSAQRAKDMLEEERIALSKLERESIGREESLVLAQSWVAYLESETYRSEIIEEYRQGMVGKAEVALACKAGYDYLKAQLPAEMRGDSDRFHYPSNVANCLEALEDIEKLGRGLDLDTVDEEDGEDENEVEATVVPAERPGGVKSSSGRRDEGNELVSQSTPPHAPASALPLTPGADMDLSASP